MQTSSSENPRKGLYPTIRTDLSYLTDELTSHGADVAPASRVSLYVIACVLLNCSLKKMNHLTAQVKPGLTSRTFTETAGLFF